VKNHIPPEVGQVLASSWMKPSPKRTIGFEAMVSRPRQRMRSILQTAHEATSSAVKSPWDRISSIAS